jgi:hypothetical protein
LAGMQYDALMECRAFVNYASFFYGHGFEVEIHALRTAPNGVNDFRGLTRRPVRRAGTKVVHGTEQFALSLLTSRGGSPENVVSNYLSEASERDP